MDRISFFPDSIISNILQYLNTDDAIRTKILGKQWRNLWFRTPNELAFHQTSQNTGLYLQGIDKFIDDKLPLNTCPKITKFELKVTICEHDSKSLENVRKVLKAAILRHVKDVVLDIEKGKSYNSYYIPNYYLEQELCSYTSLERLTLRHINVDRKLDFNWTSLKELTIGFAWVSNDALDGILLHCPMLNRLELNHCHGIYRIQVDYWNRLRNLVLIQCDPLLWWKGVKIALQIPYVECLILKLVKPVKLIDVSSLVDVSIDFYSLASDPDLSTDLTPYRKTPYRKKAKKNTASENVVNYDHKDRRDVFVELLNKVGHVKTVRLGPWSVKAISSYVKRNLISKVSSLKCNCLVLTTPIDEWDIPGVLGLMGRSPHLGTLIVDLTTEFDNNSQFSVGTKIASSDANTYWMTQNTVPPKFPKHLKNIKIVGLSRRLVGFVQYLLENAKSLEKMEMITKSNSKDDLSQIIERILHLPRSSPNAQILIS